MQCGAISMTVSDIKDESTQIIQPSQHRDNVAPLTDHQDGAATKPKEKIDRFTMAREIQQAKVERYRWLTDMREEKVQEIRSQIAKGTYNVSVEQIANKMVEKSIMNLYCLVPYNVYIL